MNVNKEVGSRKRRSSEEVKRLVVEFEASGLTCAEFCRTRGMALSTLRRNIKKRCGVKTTVKAGNRLLAVELAAEQRNKNPRTTCGLEVVLSCGRRIAVAHEFDPATLGRVVKVLEGL